MSNLYHSPSADFIQKFLEGSGVLINPKTLSLPSMQFITGCANIPMAQDNKYRIICQRVQAEVIEFSNHETIRAQEERVQALLRSAPSQHLDP